MEARRGDMIAVELAEAFLKGATVKTEYWPSAAGLKKPDTDGILWRYQA